MKKSKSKFRIGVLHSVTGVTASTERLMLTALKFAVSEINAAGGIEGEELQIVHFDPGSDVVYYRFLADELISKHGVRLIFGAYRSSTRMAVKSVVEHKNGLLFYPTQYEGFEYSPNVIYGGAVANQNSSQMAEFIAETAGPRIAIIGSDYIWPRVASRTMAEQVCPDDQPPLTDFFVKLDAPRDEFDNYLREILKTSPDGIYCNLVGPSITHFYQAYRAMGLDPAKLPIFSLTTSETDISMMGFDAGEGHFTAAPYFQSLDNARNRQVLGDFYDWLGQRTPTNLVWEATYSQVHLAAKAMQACGTDDPHQVREALMGATFDAPQGRIKIDADNGHTYLWPRIGRINASGQFDVIRESVSAVKPDPYSPFVHEKTWVMREPALLSGSKN
ncbi:transporter substrate-binding domain-containing protein [Roseivivax sediminis]|uniref:Amino acid/amide ABC transporter substrate-binding protein, HAAT family n=1 Tax=Roseivivax sediminis TaxID=936889 RepID=A0A1I2CRP4_9RHOB|nr:transporter substrate-binding domain-containing protein [Roseivivax sediminis]SFE70894.1 amino acid/amide ABC transporter substrate-binding protein, HAAT family [Roseivivax sediminis]